MLLVLWLWEKKFGPTPMWGKQPEKSDAAKKICPELMESDEVFLRSDADTNERTPLLSSASTRPKVYVPGSVPSGAVHVSPC